MFTAEQIIDWLRLCTLLWMGSAFVWMCFQVVEGEIKDVTERAPLAETPTDTIPPPPPPEKYEDKYLAKYRALSKEIVLTPAQEALVEQRAAKLFEERSRQLAQELQQQQQQQSNADNDDEENPEDENAAESDDSEPEGDFCKLEFKCRTSEEALQKLAQIFEKRDELKAECLQQARTEIIREHILVPLKRNIVVEHTPLGNVLMLYDADRESFTYYSNCNIPYRFLEPVCRKYVCTYRVPWLYVDMEQQLKEAEQRWDAEEELRKKREEEEKQRQEQAAAAGEKKKPVFAKFKSYNQQVGSSNRIPAPPKSNQMPRTLTAEQQQEKQLLKASATRFTHGGKMSNFSLLQKVPRQAVMKRLNMDYSDYKKQFQEYQRQQLQQQSKK